ncbi:hypothetical protein DKG75_01955 [Zavarzinia compransoris]|uniref:Uncharacterized protein n=1 Tax=Zavarzinia compransoris TaxID=1264899 RepID=A0A317EDR6_9PROT|nr:hypothetical protein DKG75_01955 [Zavarzinia compransoris]
MIARLRAQAMPPLRLVEGMAEIESLNGAQPRAMPAAFVTPLSERAEPAGNTLRLRQKVTVHFGVVLICRNVSDLGRGGSALVELKPVRAAVLSALYGWGETAGVTQSPIQFSEGIVIDAHAGLVAWQDTYVTTLYHQQA